MVKDPVCGMKIDPQKAAAQSVYQGQTYYFCSAICKGMFDREPEKYLGHAGNDHSDNPGHHHR